MKTRPVEPKFSKYGYTFRQVDRAGQVAIYSQTRNDNGRQTGFEVVRIRVCPAQAVFESHADFDRIEVYPGAED
jgi:hypothetical protein